MGNGRTVVPLASQPLHHSNSSATQKYSNYLPTHFKVRHYAIYGDYMRLYNVPFAFPIKSCKA